MSFLIGEVRSAKGVVEAEMKHNYYMAKLFSW